MPVRTRLRILAAGGPTCSQQEPSGKAHDHWVTELFRRTLAVLAQNKLLHMHASATQQRFVIPWRIRRILNPMVGRPPTSSRS
jgi:hypothetical protein